MVIFDPLNNQQMRKSGTHTVSQHHQQSVSPLLGSTTGDGGGQNLTQVKVTMGSRK